MPLFVGMRERSIGRKFIKKFHDPLRSLIALGRTGDELCYKMADRNCSRERELLGDFRFEYEDEIEYENDFLILVFRLHIIITRTHFIP